jgi:diguanylate cyclase (GGDEF)-like protein/PAS domain S-box-containing protein
MGLPVYHPGVKSTERPSDGLRTVLFAIVIGLVYLLMAWVCLYFSRPSDGIAWVWLPSGLALAALCLSSRRVWPVLMITVFMANVSANLLAKHPLPVSLAFGGANCIEAALAASLLLSFSRPASNQVSGYRDGIRDQPAEALERGAGMIFPFTFRRFNNLLIFFGVVIISDAFSALLVAEAASIWLGAEFWRVWLSWFISAGLGTELITPLVIVWRSAGERSSGQVRPGHIVEGAVLFVCLAITAWALYLNNQPMLIDSVLRTYLIFPFLIWAALRFDQPFVTFLLLLTCLAALLGIASGLGKLFVDPLLPQDDRLLSAQLYLLSLSGSTLILSAALAEVKTAGAAVAKNEAEYRSLFQNASIGIFHMLPTGGFLRVNPRLANMLGFVSPQEMILSGDGITSKFSEEALNYQDRGALVSREDGWTYTVNTYPRKDGSLMMGKLALRQAPGLDGAPAYLEGFVEDITERRRAEDALRANEQVMRMFVEFAPAAIAMFDNDMCYMVASKRYRKDYGLGDQVLTGRSHYEVFPEISEHWKEIHRRCLAGAVEKSEDDPFPRADGSLDFVRWEIWPWFKNEAEIGGIILLSEVTTERKRAEQALKKSELLLNETQAIAKVGGWEYDLTTQKMTWTQEVYRIYSVSADYDVNDINRSISFYALQDRLVLEQAFQNAINLGQPYDLELRFVNGKGKHKWVRTRGAPLQETGRVVKVTGTIMDISELKRAQAAMARSEEQLRLAMEASNDGMWDWRCQQNVTDYSPSYYRMLGYAPEEFPTTLDGWLNLVHPDDHAHVANSYAACLENRIQSFEIEFRLRARVGGWRWILSRGKTVSWNANSKPLRVVGTTVDIHERKEVEEALRRANRKLEKQAAANAAMQALLIEQATHDALTGLYNRRFMDDALQRELLRADRGGSAVSVLMLDIDRFKNFNDSYGHEAGNQVLVALSSLLRVNIRESDIACRYGGEEFVIILPGAGAVDARHRAELIREDFSGIRIGPESLSATISIGLAVYPQHGVNVDQLLHAADTALYAAKNAGRNCVWVFDG